MKLQNATKVEKFNSWPSWENLKNRKVEKEEEILTGEEQLGQKIKKKTIGALKLNKNNSNG